MSDPVRIPEDKENRRYTYADYLEWEGPQRYQLINGEVFLMASRAWTLPLKACGGQCRQTPSRKAPLRVTINHGTKRSSGSKRGTY